MCYLRRRQATGSTEDQLAYLAQNTKDVFQEKSKVLAVFFDLSNAFDKVWKEGLLVKLLRTGVRCKMYMWIQHFLIACNCSAIQWISAFLRPCFRFKKKFSQKKKIGGQKNILGLFRIGAASLHSCSGASYRGYITGFRKRRAQGIVGLHIQHGFETCGG